MSNLGWPDLRALELFVAVVDHGSVGAAARHTGLAQPNASRMIAELETTMKTALLERGARGSVPTSAGTELAERARQLLAAARQFNEWIHERDAEQSELVLRVGASMTIAESLLPAWLAALRRQNTHVRVDVRVLNSGQVIKHVQDGAVQLGFVETPHPPARLNATVVHDDELVVVIAPDHQWACRSGRLSLSELAQTPLVVRERGSGTREALDELLHRMDPVPPAQILSSNAAIRVAVASGEAPAALSLLAVQNQLATGELLRVPLAESIRRPLSAVWQGPRRLRGPAADLVAVSRAGP